VDVVPDVEFRADRERDRSVILYGNADTNGAWSSLLLNSPVQVDRRGVRIGAKMVAGDDLGCLFIRPRPGSAIAAVAVVAGTGLVGARATNNLPYLQPMLGLPDLLVVGADTWEKGFGGVRAAGFFGNDWSVERGDFAVAP
jgi:hypothetical protein